MCTHTHTNTRSLCFISVSCDPVPEAAIFPGTTLCFPLLELSQRPFELQLPEELIVFVFTSTHTQTQPERDSKAECSIYFPITAWLVYS